MTESEMVQRIRELEKENASLKNIVDAIEENNVGKRNVIPFEIGKKHGGRYSSSGTYFIRDVRGEDLYSLASAIRGMCFPRHIKEKNRNGRINHESFRVGVRDMTNEEYLLYADIVDQVLDVVTKYIYHPVSK